MLVTATSCEEEHTLTREVAMIAAVAMGALALGGVLMLAVPSTVRSLRGRRRGAVR